MRALKSIVIALGLVLVAGFGVLVYGISQNWHRMAMPLMPAIAPAPPVAVVSGGWGSVALPHFPGARVAAVTASGDLVIVHLHAESGDRLVTVDPRTGAVVGTFAVGEGP